MPRAIPPDSAPTPELVGGDGGGDALQLLRGDGERQLKEQTVDLAVVQVRGAPAAEQDDVAGDLGGHEWVAVAVAADPRANHKRHAVWRQRLRADLAERVVDRAHKVGQRVPELRLRHEQARPRLVLHALPQQGGEPGAH